jgi:hypothetical protein
VSVTNIRNPHVTVSAILEQIGRFLLVEEETAQGLQCNQPADQLDPGESPLDAVRRETVEETVRAFGPKALLQICRPQVRSTGTGDLRFAFCGELGAFCPDRALNTGMVHTVRLAPDEIEATAARRGTPLVAHWVQDYLTGRRYRLEVPRGRPD